MLKKIIDFVLKYEKIVIPVFTTAFVGLGYFSANFINIFLSQRYGRYVHLETNMDEYIPFVPTFIFIYILYYFYPILFPMVVRKRTTLYVSALSFIILQIFSVTSFIMIPSKMIRPFVEAGGEPELLLVNFIYTIDSGFNLLPSLHVAHTTVITLLFFHTRHRWRYAVACITFLICCSTVLVKQHYIIDVPFGFLFAFTSFYGALGMVRMLEKPLDLKDELRVV